MTADASDRLPDWAYVPENYAVTLNTTIGNSHAFGVLMGFDAFRLCNGQPTKSFTKRAVLRWITVMQARTP